MCVSMCVLIWALWAGGNPLEITRKRLSQRTQKGEEDEKEEEEKRGEVGVVKMARWVVAGEM